MTTETHMNCDVSEDENFEFLATSHGDYSDFISIHGIDLDCSIRCSIPQAKRLITELELAILMTGVTQEKGE